MIDIDELNSSDSLAQWLKDWRKSVGLSENEERLLAAQIAHRASLRVMPIALAWFTGPQARNRDILPLAMLRCTVVAQALSVAPKEQLGGFETVSRDAAEALNELTKRVPTEVKFAAEAIGSSVRVREIGRDAFEKTVDLAAKSAARIDLSSNVGAGQSLYWHQISQDVRRVVAKGSLPDAELWFDGAPQWFEQAFSELRTNTDGQSENWKYWFYFFDELNAGRNLNWEMLQDIAILDETVWRSNAETVSNKISNIRAKHAVDPNTELTSRVSAIEKSIELKKLEDSVKILGYVENTSNDAYKGYKELQAHFSQLENKFNEAVRANDDLINKFARFNKETDVQIKKAKEVEQGLVVQLTDTMNATVAAFREEQAVKEPVELWETKRTEHLLLMQKAFGMFIFGIALTCGLIGFALYQLSLGSEQVATLLQPVGCNPETRPELCSGFSLRGVLVAAASLTVITLALWFTRLQMKIYLSERHLALDARERKAFAQAYVGLLAENDTSEEARGQRALVYSALFRPSTDGIIKDEGSIDPSISAAISKLLSK